MAAAKPADKEAPKKKERVKKVIKVGAEKK